MGFFAVKDSGWTVWFLLGSLVAFLIAIALVRFLGTLLFAIFVYYAVRPLYRRFNEYVDHPDLTVTLTLLVIILPLLLVLSYTALIALQEFNHFLSTHTLGQYRGYLQPYLSLVREGRLQRLQNILLRNPAKPLNPATRQILEASFGTVETALQFVFVILGRLFLMIVFVFYLLRDDHRLANWFYESCNYETRIVEFTSHVDDDLETVFFGNLVTIIVSGVIATATYFGLNLIASGRPVVTIPVLLGLLTAIATLVPLVGMKIVYVPYTLYLSGLVLFTSTPLWYPVGFFLSVFIIVDTIPDFFIRSYLAAGGSIHMGLLLIGYVLGTMAFGWYGVFLGPVVVVLAVHFATEIFPTLVDEGSFG